MYISLKNVFSDLDTSLCSFPVFQKFTPRRLVNWESGCFLVINIKRGMWSKKCILILSTLLKRFWSEKSHIGFDIKLYLILIEKIRYKGGLLSFCTFEYFQIRKLGLFMDKVLLRMSTLFLASISVNWKNAKYEKRGFVIFKSGNLAIYGQITFTHVNIIF